MKRVVENLRSSVWMMTYLFSSSVVSLGQAQLELREMPKTPCNLLFKYSHLSTLLYWLIYNLRMHINIWKASVRNRGNSPLGDWVRLHAWHKAMISVRLSLQQARLHAHKLLRLSCFMAESSVKFSSCTYTRTLNHSSCFDQTNGCSVWMCDHLPWWGLPSLHAWLVRAVSCHISAENCIIQASTSVL